MHFTFSISVIKSTLYISGICTLVLPEGPIVIMRDEDNGLINTSLVYKV